MRKITPCLSLLLLLLCLPAFGALPRGAEVVGTRGGRTIIRIVVPGHPRPAGYVSRQQASFGVGDVVLPDVPVYDWCYGCTATSATMMMGYYDRHDYANLYAGPAGGGVCPLNNETAWAAGESPLSATHIGYDGRTGNGHVEDFWGQPNPCGTTPTHTDDCLADFMGTSQNRYGTTADGSTLVYTYGDGSPLNNYDAGSTSRDAAYGMGLYATWRGYGFTANFNQLITEMGNTYGFSFDDYCTEIDAGRPVLIQVQGHTMLGTGYNRTGNVVWLCNTWDHTLHTMTWGGSYEGMSHYAVTVFRFQPLPTAAVRASVASVSVTEGGTKTYGVYLSAQPAGNVTVTTSRLSGSSALSVSAGATLTFTTSNWSVPQLVTLSAPQDTNAINDTAVFSSGATGYTSVQVTGTQADDDRRLIASPTSITVPEGGTQTYGIRLAGQPAGDVVVSTGRQSGDASLRVTAGGSLTFTPANWGTAQLVTLGALDDVDTLNGQATFRSSATGWASIDIVATEQDNDLHFVAAPSPITVPEGGTNTFSVRLAGQPAANVVVSAGRQSGDASLRVSAGGSLTFTPANWNVAQLVTLSALEDIDTINGQATFRLSAAGWPSLDVTATSLDNDLHLIATPLSLTVPEGGTHTFSVRLAGQPAGNVVVSAGRQSGDSSLRVSAGGSLTFTPTNWNVAQIVTIYALPDSDTVNGQATFRLSAPGWPSVDVVATEQEPASAAPSMAPAPAGGS